ncbi:CPBP family intramembrane metalloprotease [Pelomonas sp. V22]|uniref:CPBP family intramembrane glutamic endopeptidase n=1 Tax=Pelomonas sp. V22 TaxID=2822139 RepID=UPI0024A8F1BD|nr:CPBP family intramembrane glutamic endopeptidase [Pelomonas sp. V22]MDI4635590.1 CPBP family intramembrane metalloprotease [Pelomonas sp. V22]
MTSPSWRRLDRRFVVVLLGLLACYHAAELVGTRWLHSVFWQGLLMTAVLPLALLLGAWFWRAPLRSYALEIRPGAGRWLLGGLVAALLAKLAAVTLGVWLGAYAASAPAVPSGASPSGLLAFMLLATFIPSLAEDLLTRGLWWRHGPLRSGMGSVLLSTAVYVLNHVWLLANGPLEWLRLASFGLAYAVALMRTGSLWAALGLHWGWNLANSLLSTGLDLQTLQPTTSVALSVGAHLLLAALCLLFTRTASSRS